MVRPEQEGRIVKHVDFTGTSKVAYGFPLSELKVKEGFPPLPKKGGLPFSGGYDAFETKAELAEAKEELSDAEQVKARNAQRKAKAKSAAAKASWEAAGIEEPTMKNSVLLQLQSVYDGIFAGGKKTKAEARAMASAIVEAEWPDDDDDE
jgi:hypothetical protein